jgi:hypothetical protein
MSSKLRASPTRATMATPFAQKPLSVYVTTPGFPPLPIAIVIAIIIIIIIIIASSHHQHRHPRRRRAAHQQRPGGGGGAAGPLT